MIGLPFEQDDDISEINKLNRMILKTCPSGSIKLSLSAFVPKPHTPFESVEFAPIEELEAKIERIRSKKRRRLDIKYQSPQVSYIEAVLSRADEKIFPVIEDVYNKGSIFEEWREGFDFSRWQDSFQKYDIDPGQYLKTRENYPWDIIETGVSKDFLQKEFHRARLGLVTENCFYKKCTKCGACDGKGNKHSESQEKYQSVAQEPRKPGQQIMYRVKYSVGEPFRYASHLDIARTVYRALRRTELPIKFTQGFSPIPKVSFCPPKSVGQTSKGEFFDIYLDTEYFGNISRELNARFPVGIRVLDIRALDPRTPSLSSSINLIEYEVDITEGALKKQIDTLSKESVFIETKSGKKDIAAALDSISLNNGKLTCGLYYGGGQINIYDLISYLTGLTQDQAKCFKVTRTMMFTKREDELYSPMEAK
jgi:radical SAM-linked protein